MSAPLWTREDFVAGAGGTPRGDLGAEITGISIDTRTITEGEAFFAIKGDRFDGHDFVGMALEKGASVAVISVDKYDGLPKGGRYLVVDDPLKAMERLAVASRARSNARIVAVTGSVGKTGTKEALRLTLGASGKVHASVASFNNHWGVPLTLARMPADVDYGVFEIGMSAPNEITPLVKMVRPHVAIITTVQAVHLEFFESVEHIAKAKAEIFKGLEPGGVAILNRDNNQFDLLMFLAKAENINEIRTFGETQNADSFTESIRPQAGSSAVRARILGEEISYTIGAGGRHHVQNSLAVLTAVVELGASLSQAGKALATMHAPKGRGEVTVLHLGEGTAELLDESYNANPASMRAALSVLGEAQVVPPGRRIAVLGDMRELGEDSDRLHAELADPLLASNADAVFCAGPHMRKLWERVPQRLRVMYAEQAADLEDRLLQEVKPGDVIMIKGSLGTKMGPLVDALKTQYPPKDDSAAG